MRKLLLVLAVILAVLAGGSAILPRDYEVSRSAVVAAPAAALHAWVGDLARWPRWVAWCEDDGGAGCSSPDPATLSWEDAGRRQVLRVTFSNAGRGLWYDLAEERDSRSNGTPVQKGALLYEVHEDGTRITWVQRGELGSGPVARFAGLFVDARIGPDLQHNLDNLKRLVEAP